MAFYVYRQNNSGGYFIEDENVGVHLIIEADTEAQADEKFEAIIDLKDKYSTFCPCCGHRWYGVDEMYDNVELTEEFVDELKEHKYYLEAVLHKADGTKTKIPWLMYGMYKYLDAEVGKGE